MLQSGAWFLRLAPTATDYHLLHFLSQIDVRSLFDRRPFEFQGDEYQLTWQWVEHRPRHIQALEQASLTLSRAEYDTLTSDPTFMFPIVGRWLTTANEVPHLWIEVVPHASLVDSFANTSPRNSRMFASSMSDVAAAVERLHRAGLRHGALNEGCLFVSKSLSGVRIGEWSRLRVNDDGNQLDEASLTQMKQRLEQRWFAGHATGLLEGAPRFRSNIVRVRFAAHSTCFSADTLVTRLGDYVVVPGDRGINVGEVIEVDCIASCVAPVERLATPVEAALAAELAAVDRSSLLTEVRHYVYEFAATKKASDMLQLEVLAVETQFDHAKLTVYYRHRAGGAVRLAPLIAFLFLRFRRRIWMQPVASRVMSPIPVCAPVA